MKRNTKYVGLDVHQAMTVATVRGQGGRVIARSVIETGDASITEFFSAMRGSVHRSRSVRVFEEGTQAQWLYDLLSPRVDRVIVCDRRGEKAFGQQGGPGRCRRAVGAVAVWRAASGIPRRTRPI